MSGLMTRQDPHCSILIFARSRRPPERLFHWASIFRKRKLWRVQISDLLMIVLPGPNAVLFFETKPFSVYIKLPLFFPINRADIDLVLVWGWPFVFFAVNRISHPREPLLPWHSPPGPIADISRGVVNPWTWVIFPGFKLREFLQH